MKNIPVPDNLITTTDDFETRFYKKISAENHSALSIKPIPSKEFL